MKRLALALLLVAMPSLTAMADASKVGSAGAQFLKIGMGSRYQAMGEAAVAATNDVYAMYWNPAGLAEVEHWAVGFTNVNWVLDINLNYVGFAKYVEDVGVFGVSATVLSADDQEIRTFEQQDGTGDYYSVSSYTVGLSYARQLTTRFAFGATFKYIQENIYREKASGFGFDFGTMLYTGYQSLRLGMSISNMGPELQFDGPDLDIRYDDQTGEGANAPIGARLKTTPYDLPLLFRVGVAYDLDFGPKTIVTFAGEVKHPSDNQQQGALGAELDYDGQYFLRGGYKINYEEEGATLGAGLKSPLGNDTSLLIDYAWQDFGRLQSTHRFSIGFTFD